MEKAKLEQYKSLVKEIPLINKKLDKLYEKRLNIPMVKGKVKASSKEFPYIETHVSVLMDEPKEADKLSEQIKVNEKRLKQVEEDVVEIERFIANIPNSTDRLILELVYLKGMKLKDAGEIVGYSKGRVSQKISEILKD